MEMLYLIHFDQPRHHARHYLGSAANLLARLRRHATGHGARLTQVLAEDNQQWQLAAAWTLSPLAPSLRFVEAAAKRRHSGRVYCPLCCTQPQQPQWTIPYPLAGIRSDELRDAGIFASLASRIGREHAGTQRLRSNLPPLA